MTNVSAPHKVSMRTRLFQVAQEALEAEGWKVERATGMGKGSVRRITLGSQTKLVSIRTSQNQYIAFPRTPDDKQWNTLDDVDAVVAVSVDDRENPTEAKVHFIEADEVRRRFDQAYQARRDAGHSVPVGRGIWVPLYLPHAETPVYQVGGGLGLDFPPIAETALVVNGTDILPGDLDEDEDIAALPASPVAEQLRPLTISEAKRQLAETFGVSPDQVKITIEA